MALQYKIEFLQDDTADDSAFIHVRADLPVFAERIGKEDYQQLSEEEKSGFMGNLFNIAGITEVAVQAFRLWVMKSPAYQWSEVLDNVLSFLQTQTGEDGLEALPGSANTDGSGIRLESISDRRSL